MEGADYYGLLSGTKVIDSTRWLPGRWATGVLADYGADVVSVVEPGFWERAVGRPGVTGRNQRSILLNLKADGARDIFYKLVSNANAMLESHRPGVAARLGIDYEAVRRINATIVYCSLSGYGQYGPYRNLAGHDLNFQAIGGMVPQDRHGRPSLPSYEQADRNAATNAAMALILGLLYQARTGKGQYVDVAFSDSVIELPPGGHRRGMLAGDDPGYNIYECSDGEYITLGIVDPQVWERLCDALNCPDLIALQHPAAERRNEVFSFFRETFKARTQAEWFAFLRAVDVEVAPLNRTTAAVTGDAHNRARASVLRLNDRPGAAARYERGFALRFSETPGSVRWPARREGSDTREVVRGLGYSDSEIAGFAERGVIRIDDESTASHESHADYDL